MYICIYTDILGSFIPAQWRCSSVAFSIWKSIHIGLSSSAPNMTEVGSG